MSPTGAVHHNFWKTAWFLPLLIATMLFVLVGVWAVPVGIILGYAFGYYIDPDLDLMSTTSAEGRMVKIPILGILLVTYWTPYGAIFRKQHRSFWTHSYIFSTVIRFVYMFWWLLFFKYTEYWFWMVMLGAFAGLAIADAIHIWADRRFG